jgi:hypothetical protein
MCTLFPVATDPFHTKVIRDNIKAFINLLPVFLRTQIRTNKHGSGSGDRERPSLVRYLHNIIEPSEHRTTYSQGLDPAF